MCVHNRMENLSNCVKDLIEKLLFEGSIDLERGYEEIDRETVSNYITGYQDGDSSSVYIGNYVYEWNFDEGKLNLEWEV